jgi:ABC-type Fe3+-hydroxamate transport system substrate-binding protein
MPPYQDQIGNTINLTTLPKRIVSLVPSQTELLFELGLDREIVGVTKFCIHPKIKIKSVAKIGGTKSLSINKIKALRPDLIIANKEENEQDQIETLQKIYPVWTSDISKLADAFDMITNVGQITGKIMEAQKMVQRINQGFSLLNSNTLNLRVAYFIWRKPYMVAGRGTFINDVLQKCGFENVIKLDRYPEIYAGNLIEAKPDVVLLSTEPYPFKDRHIEEFKTLLPNAIIKLVDGEIFSWYGSRLLHAPAYLNKLITDLTNIHHEK